jgi:hypothetical protein
MLDNVRVLLTNSSRRMLLCDVCYALPNLRFSYTDGHFACLLAEYSLYFSSSSCLSQTDGSLVVVRTSRHQRGDLS